MTDASHTPNFRSAAAQMHQAEGIYRGLFERAPLPLLVLTPDVRIVNANDAYLAATGRRRDALAGRDMFEAFPDSPHHPGADGVRNLSRSLARVLKTGQRDLMPLQRYDIQPENGPWEVRFWHPANWAILGEAGSVLALVHHVTDATAGVLTHRSTFAAANPRLRAADLFARANAAIREAGEVQAEAREGLSIIRRQVRALLKGPD